jgi:hypothetical protein
MGATMIRKRRNAYLAGLFILVGVLLLIMGTFMPAINVTATGSTSVLGFTISKSASVGVPSLLPIMLAFGSMLLWAAAVLAFVRRRGLGILLRAWTLGCLIVPAMFTGTFWFLVQRPPVTGSKDVFSIGKHITARAQGDISVASAGAGLWLLTLGCVVVIVGCFVPSTKYRELIIRDDDPRFWDFNPHIREFEQHQERRYQEQQNAQRAPTPPQSLPITDSYGESSYYGTD